MNGLVMPERLSRPQQVGQGQLWLASQGDESLYVVVLAMEGDTVVVTMMDNDVRLQTDDSMVFESSPLDMPMVLYPQLTMHIPTALLDVYCGRFDHGMLHDAVRFTPAPGLKRGVDHVPAWLEHELKEHVLRLVRRHELCKTA